MTNATVSVIKLRAFEFPREILFNMYKGKFTLILQLLEGFESDKKWAESSCLFDDNSHFVCRKFAGARAILGVVEYRLNIITQEIQVWLLPTTKHENIYNQNNQIGLKPLKLLDILFPQYLC